MKKLLRRNSGNGRLSTWDSSKNIPISYVLNEYEEDDDRLTFYGTIKASDMLLLSDVINYGPNPEACILTLEDDRHIRVFASTDGVFIATHGFF
jgi:hypothetical protein